MKTLKKITALTLTLVLAFSLAACGAAAPETSPATTLPEIQEQPQETKSEGITLEDPGLVKANVSVLNGTTGFGMANLMDASARGETALDYTFSVETDASNIVAALANGNPVKFSFPGHVCHVFNKETGLNLEA